MDKLLSLKEEMERRNVIAEQIMADDPRISHMSAMIIAGDRDSADRMWKALEEGMPYREASAFVGSYARLDFALKALKAGYVDENTILDDLPDLWRSSDPDDMNPEFLELWKKAWERNGRKTVCDGKSLPRRKWLVVYRGQDETGVFGWAWSLDKAIAEKFARGAGTRQWDRGGIVYIGKVQSSRVYGYLTLRGEEEVVLNPNFVVPIG